MRSISKAACFITFFLFAVVLEVEGRSLKDPASELTSDGVDSVQPKNSYLLLKSVESSEGYCKQMYGFLPCSTNIFGHLFLILVYEYLLFHGESYLANGGEQIFEILGPGLFGASAFDILGALPESLIVLASGLFSNKESAQEYVTSGIGLLAGSSILLLTVVWGTCVITGSKKLKNDSRSKVSDVSNSSSGRLKKVKEWLTGFGITRDVETSEMAGTSKMAGIMVLSVIPLLIMQIPNMFQFPSEPRAVTLIIALIIAIIFLFSYFIYQIFEPQIEIVTRLEYVKHHHLILRIFQNVKKDTLHRILSENGTPNEAAISRIYTEINQNRGNGISASELQKLLLKNNLTEKNVNEKEQIKEMLRIFDENGDEIITKEEFVNGIKKYLAQTRHALDRRYLQRKSLKEIYQLIIKPCHQFIKKELEMKGHLISDFLKYVQSDMVGRLLTDDGTPDESAIRSLFDKINSNGDENISQSELKELVMNIQFDKVDAADAVTKIIEEFDRDSDHVISEEEFVEGLTKWVKTFSSQSAVPISEPGKDIHKIWGGVDKEVEEKENESKAVFTWFKAIFNVVLGIAMLSVLAEPLIASVQKFSQAAGIPSFFVSFILVPVATNFREAFNAASAMEEGSHKKRGNGDTSQTFYEIYGAVFMNNILGFLVISILIYVRDITWEFSAELLVVAIVCAIMGLTAFFHTTFPRWTSFCAYLLYILSLVLVFVLSHVLNYV